MIAFCFYHCLPSRLRSAILLLPMLSTLLLVLPPCAHAQKQQLPQETTFRFRRLGTEQGLAQNTVFDVLQDRKGFLWIATGDGLCRWDGYNVKTWRHDSKDSTSLSHFLVGHLLLDTSGNVWVSTLDGVNMLNRSQSTFTRFYDDNHEQNNTLIASHAYSYLTLHEDNTPLILYSQGVFAVNRQKKKLDALVLWNEQDSLIKGKIAEFVPTLLMQRQKLLFAFNDTAGNKNIYHLLEFNVKTKTLQRQDFLPPRGILPELDQAKIIFVRLYDKNGSFWIQFGKSANNCQMLIWNPALKSNSPKAEMVESQESSKGLRVREIRSPYGSGKLFQLDNSFAVRETITNEYWTIVGTRKTLLLDSTYSIKSINSLRYSVQDMTTLGSSLVLSFSFGDYAPKRYWIATDGSGVNFVVPPVKFPHFTPFRSRMTWAMTEDNLGNLWAATMGDAGGLGSYNIATGKSEEYLPKERNYSIFHDSHGNIWAGQHDEGLCKFPPNGSKRRSMIKYKLLNFYHPHCIIEDRLGMLWITSENNVIRFDPKTGKITHRFNDLGMILKTDGKGRIWAGGKGIFVFDPADADRISFYGQDSTPHLFTRYLNDPKNPRSLGNDVIKCFHEDPDGAMWIATITGLDHLDPKTGVFRHYTEADGMPNNYTYGILPDEEGNLWVSTNRGLSRFNPKTGAWRNYSPADGLQSYEFDRLSFCKLRDGRLVFGGVNGFNMFRPEDVQDNTTPPPVAIVELEINDRPYQQVLSAFAPNTPQYSIREVSELTALELGYNDNTLTFDFAALDFTDPAKNLYAYKMDGVDKDWVQSGTLRKTRYAGLNPGDYTFRVKACNNDGVWNEVGTALQIRILPPFWRTVWFYALCGVSLITAVGGGTRFVVRQRFRQQVERLEAAQRLEREQMQRELVLERERGRIAKDIHDEVGPGMMRIAVLAEAVQEGNISSSGNISTTAQEVIDAMNGIIWMTNPKNDTLDNLAAYIQEKAGDWFDRIGANKGMVLDFVLPEDVPALALEGTVRRNLYLSVKEALNNALKHSEASRIEISLTLLGEKGFAWRVSDNGKGFEAIDISRFSNGLANMRSRLEEIGGELQIESRAGQGTSINFRVGNQMPNTDFSR